MAWPTVISRKDETFERDFELALAIDCRRREKICKKYREKTRVDRNRIARIKLAARIPKICLSACCGIKPPSKNDLFNSALVYIKALKRQNNGAGESISDTSCGTVPAVYGASNVAAAMLTEQVGQCF